MNMATQTIGGQEEDLANFQNKAQAMHRRIRWSRFADGKSKRKINCFRKHWRMQAV